MNRSLPGPAEARGGLLARLGGGEREIRELLAYDDPAPRAAAPRLGAPLLADEPHLAVWGEYARTAARDGVLAALANHLPQLRFPVAAGISERPDYRAATRGGAAPPADSSGPRFVRPEEVRLEIVVTAAGRLPVLMAGERNDFELLVQSLAHRNEPVPVPPSMGACLVKGLVNPDRVRRHREEWHRAHPGASPAEWSAEQVRFAADKPAYQDRVLILSEGPYSAVPAVELGLGEAEWRRTSTAIRLAHEATHYLTLRLFGSARNHLWDELVADFVGLVSGTGQYREAWALRFLGVDPDGRFRPGGRLAIYRGTPALSDPAFTLLARLVPPAVAALARLAAAGQAFPLSDPSLPRLLLALAPLGVVDFALAAEAEEGLPLVAV